VCSHTTLFRSPQNPKTPESQIKIEFREIK